MSEGDKVRRYFSRSAAGFDSIYDEDKVNFAMRFINRHFRHDMYERFELSLNHVQRYGLKTALDVGCGSGRYALALAQLGVRRIVGVDLSRSMLDLAIKTTRQFPQENTKFEFICYDFMDLQTEETFDVILAMGFFDYIKDPVPVLQKMKALAHHSVIASFPSISIYRTPIRKTRYFFKRCPVYFYNYDKIVSYSDTVGFSRSEIVKIKGSGMDYFAAFYK